MTAKTLDQIVAEAFPCNCHANMRKTPYHWASCPVARRPACLSALTEAIEQERERCAEVALDQIGDPYEAAFVGKAIRALGSGDEE